MYDFILCHAQVLDAGYAERVGHASVRARAQSLLTSFVRAGLPILKAVFHGPATSIVAVPLLLWHPSQILFGGIIAPFLARWRQQKAVGSGLPCVRASHPSR